MTVGRIPVIEGGIQPTIFDAKGDLLTATANDTPARLAVGANDLLLTAASGEATGLKYTGGWTSYTPTLSNLTLGNGTLTAKYNQIGKIMFVRINVILGSTSSMGSFPSATLPKNAAVAGYLTGTVTALDSGTANYMTQVYITGSNNAEFGVTLTNGTYAKHSAITSSEPFTWVATDQLNADFYYEVA
jgi:hypothetical protein